MTERQSTETVLTDAVLTYWLNGTHDDDMREWWETPEAVSCAEELVGALLQAITDQGWYIAQNDSDPPPAPLVADPQLVTHLISRGTKVPPAYPTSKKTWPVDPSMVIDALVCLHYLGRLNNKRCGECRPCLMAALLATQSDGTVCDG